MKYVFNTTVCKRYAFPTHSNDLVVDRADAATSEVFIVIVEPGKATHLHMHNDVEQIFYIIEGEGMLAVGPDKKRFTVKPSQVVKIPPKTLHTVSAKGKKALRYICIDCFCGDKKADEPTWEAHVHAICREQGYAFKDIIGSTKPDSTRKKSMTGDENSGTSR
jgi:mannose-6-phosphate isomerase-like protein (cupin superfamily)